MFYRFIQLFFTGFLLEIVYSLLYKKRTFSSLILSLLTFLCIFLRSGILEECEMRLEKELWDSSSLLAERENKYSNEGK